MGSKNKSQYASLPNLSNQDLICQQMKTRRAISNTNINSFALRREHGVSLYKDHTSNIFDEKNHQIGVLILGVDVEKALSK